MLSLGIWWHLWGLGGSLPSAIGYKPGTEINSPAPSEGGQREHITGLIAAIKSWKHPQKWKGRLISALGSPRSSQGCAGSSSGGSKTLAEGEGILLAASRWQWPRGFRGDPPPSRAKGRTEEPFHGVCCASQILQGLSFARFYSPARPGDREETALQSAVQSQAALAAAAAPKSSAMEAQPRGGLEPAALHQPAAGSPHLQAPRDHFTPLVFSSHQ